MQLRNRGMPKHPVLAYEMAVSGMTSKELSEAIGVHPITISRISNLRQDPTLKTAMKIADALDTTLEALGWAWLEEKV